MKTLTTAFAGLALASPVLAHPGHDAALQGAAHYAFSPVHGLGVIAAAGLAALVVHLIGKGARDE